MWYTQRMLTLPAWLEKQLPVKEEPHVLSYRQDLFYVTYNNETVGTYSLIEEAYDAHDVDWVFDESLNNSSEGNLSNGFFFCDNMRLLCSIDDDLRYSILTDAYENFLTLNSQYQEDPDHWVAAYQWLDHHPAFWIKEGINKEDSTWNWKTENIDSIWHFAAVSQGKPYVLMEAGGHTNNFLMHYHDLRLDVNEETFELAYVALAKKVNMFFNPDGTEIPNVEYEKSDLELELTRRLQSLKD